MDNSKIVKELGEDHEKPCRALFVTKNQEQECKDLNNKMVEEVADILHKVSLIINSTVNGDILLKNPKNDCGLRSKLLFLELSWVKKSRGNSFS